LQKPIVAILDPILFLVECVTWKAEELWSALEGIVIVSPVDRKTTFAQGRQGPANSRQWRFLPVKRWEEPGRGLHRGSDHAETDRVRANLKENGVRRK
jgi:hypothetical protein